MEVTRREFIVVGSVTVASMLASSCGSEKSSSPTAPSSPSNPPQVPNAEILNPPPTNYNFAVKANVAFSSVLNAFDAAKVSYDENGVGKITSINGSPSSPWKIDVNEIPFCTTARKTSVPVGAVIGCYIEDGRKVKGSCVSDNPV